MAEWNWDNYYLLNRQGRGNQTPVGRYLTYSTYPVTANAFPTRLHATGCYYTGFQDEVQCDFCPFIYSNWNEGDIAEERHRLHSPECPFLTGNHTAVGGVGHMELDDIAVVRLFTEETNSFSFDDYIALHEGCISDMSSENKMETIYNRDQSIHNTGVENSNKFLQSHTRGFDANGDVGDSDNAGASAMTFEDVRARLRSYQPWPIGHIADPNILAGAGFYYTGAGDMIRCYKCLFEIRNLYNGMDPWEEHARLYPYCDYLRQHKGDCYIQRIRQTTQARDAIQTNPTEPRTIIQKKRDEESSIRFRQAPESSRDVLRSNNVELSEQGGERIDNEEEMQELFDTKCKKCRRRESDMVFLPCRHLVCCRLCADGCSICISCRQTIMGKARIYR